MSGIRDAIVKVGFLDDPVGLLKAVGKTVETNVPRKTLPDLAEAEPTPALTPTLTPIATPVATPSPS